MQYDEVIDYLYSRLPMFTRDGAAAIKKDLTNTIKLCEALGNPQDAFRSIHVAGTNGKGSSSHMLASVLQSAGYKTGLYTSPHLLDFRERIRINGAMISKEDVVYFISQCKDLIEEIGPSFFEVTVAMAFHHFAASKVDVAVIETGLGGRLDSTNIINPLLSLITNIGMDHTNLLGDTIEQIAAEKAGIIKAHTPAIISERQHAVKKIFTAQAHANTAPLTFASDEWTIVDLGISNNARRVRAVHLSPETATQDYQLDLTGAYQLKNICGVLSCIKILRQQGFDIADEAVRQGLRHVQAQTGLMGRWQSLAKHPTVICDTGHNQDGWIQVVDNLKSTTFQNLHIVMGVMRDKDLSHMLPLLPENAHYYFCNPDFPRALPSEDLYKEASGYNLTGESYNSVEQAVQSAMQQAAKEDLIFIGGSTFVVSEALPIFGY